MKRQGVKLWTARRGELDTVRAVLDGDRATEESSRKSEAVSDGIGRRRDERGQPVGGMPFGYTVENQIVGGNVVSRRVADPTVGPLRVQLHERVADPATPGSVARWLNANAIKTARGKAFTAKAVVQIVERDVDPGGKGYPALVSAELKQAARDGLRHPAAIQQRKGGRPPDPSYFLRGMAFCTCGEPLYRSDKWLGGFAERPARPRLAAAGRAVIDTRT